MKEARGAAFVPSLPPPPRSQPELRRGLQLLASLLSLFIMQSRDSHVHTDGILMCEGFLTLLLVIYLHLYLFSYFLFMLQASTNNHSKFRATSQTSATVFSATFFPHHLAEQRNPIKCDKLRSP